MNSQEKINKNPWHFIRIFFGRKLSILSIGANLVGACVVSSYFVFFDQALQNERVKGIFVTTGIMFVCLVIIAMVFSRRWSKPLNRYIQLKLSDQNIDPQLQARAQQKILNLPYFSSLISLFTWCAAAITMSIYAGLDADPGASVLEYVYTLRVFVGIVIAGIVVCAIIFFSVEAFCRKIWPHFFPDGGLIKTPGTFRLRLRIRMLATFVLASILPLVLMAVLSYNKASMMLVMEPSVVIRSLLHLTAFLLVVTLAIAIILSHLFSTSIVNPVRKMEKAMAKVEQADFTAAVAVESNDELGALADNFNHMTEGLKERYRLRRSLDLAREVQQNLLPKENPSIEGLDIAGKSIYCDETGGDYFDFLKKDEGGDDKFAVVIGDVSEHGIPSALLMATARAFIRQRSALTGNIASVVSDVNQQLTRDVEDTGRFMTLFYLRIDLSRRHLHWVRAGHDPAILYDPHTDRFEELGGEGMAMGVNKNWLYQEYEKGGLSGGQIIMLSTDGLWEAQNPSGEMFGKEPLYEIIRRYASANAQHILDAVIEELTRFQKSMQRTDDITLVIIKVDGSISTRG